jgi:hypothetical protein
MYSRWGTKSARRSKHGIRKTQIHWDVLGLQDPAVTSSTSSIEEIRRQVISASNYGLSSETLAPTQTQGLSRQSGSKAAVTIPKQRVRS